MVVRKHRRRHRQTRRRVHLPLRGHSSQQAADNRVCPRQESRLARSGRVPQFSDDKTEWTGTDIALDISTQDGTTEVRFANIGLVADFECFDSCSGAWGFYINTSLRNLIATGDGQPNQQEHEDEGVSS